MHHGRCFFGGWPSCQQQWVAPSQPAAPPADWWWCYGSWSCVPVPVPVPWFSAAAVQKQSSECGHSSLTGPASPGPGSALHKAKGSRVRRVWRKKGNPCPDNDWLSSISLSHSGNSKWAVIKNQPSVFHCPAGCCVSSGPRSSPSHSAALSLPRWTGSAPSAGLASSA